MSVDGSLWYVKLADGDVERVTLDQLDEAFQNGQIDENSMVLAAGSDQWLKLSELLGLADATPPPPPPTPVPQAFARAPAARPQAFQPPPVTVRPLAVIPVMQPRPMMRPPVAAPIMAGAISVRPVAFDLGNQFDAGDVSYPKRSRKGLVVGFLGTAAVLGAAAFFVATRTAHSAAASDATPVFAAAIAPPAPPPLPVTPTPPSTPQTAMPGPSPVMDPTQRLSDDQKQKLLEAEKKSKSHAKSHGGGGGGGGATASAQRSKSSSASFTTTGSKYDPLNSSM